MLAEAGVHIFTNTLVAGAVKKGKSIEGVITQGRSGREYFRARCWPMLLKQDTLMMI